jgi:hypothetical protein
MKSWWGLCIALQLRSRSPVVATVAVGRDFGMRVVMIEKELWIIIEGEI